MKHSKNKKKKKIYFGASIILPFAIAIALSIHFDFWKAQQVLGGPFSAISASGPWNYQDDAKDLNLLYMGYTRCPDLCPMTLSFAGQAFKKLTTDELSRIRFLFLDLDSANDNAKLATNYVQQFYPGFIGLSAPRAQIDAIVSSMGSRYSIDGDSISHSNRIYLLNHRGLVRASLPNADSADIIVKVIRENL